MDDTEIDGMINGSLGRWHSMLIRAVPERYEATQTITADGSASYDAPGNYLATMGVDYKEDEENWVALRRIMPQERTRFNVTTSGQAVGYYVAETPAKVFLLPQPEDGTYRHTYITVAPTLSSGGDSIDGFNGWEQWIVYDVAAKMLMKEESAPDWIIRERNQIASEIRAAAQEREMMNPQRVVQKRRHWHPFSGFRMNRNDPDFWYGR